MHIYNSAVTVFRKVIRLCHHQKMKFLFTGALNTVFGYSAYAAFIFIGIPYLISLLMATVLGVIFNYHSLGRIVFQNSGGIVVFLKFINVYIAVYFVNAIVLEILTNYCLLSPYVAQVICILPIIIINWLLMNYWVYNRS